MLSLMDGERSEKTGGGGEEEVRGGDRGGGEGAMSQMVLLATFNISTTSLCLFIVLIK